MERKRRILVGIALLLITAVPSSYAQRLPQAKPEDVGMSLAHLNLINELMKEAIGRKDFPGAVIVVGRKGGIVFRRGVWRKRMGPRTQTDGHLHDLRPGLGDQTGRHCDLDHDPGRAGAFAALGQGQGFCAGIFPYIEEGGKPGEDARIWHLLTHTSGLPPYTDAKTAAEKCGEPCPVGTLVKYIAGLNKNNPPGRVFDYSCLGFITLADIVQKITGKTIAEFAAENIFKPLDMSHTLYNPPEKYPTSVSRPWSPKASRSSGLSTILWPGCREVFRETPGCFRPRTTWPCSPR